VSFDMAKSFATDILPMFKPGDIGCMAPRGILIGSADWMCDPTAGNGYPDHGNARRVHSALSRGVMPPNRKWPQDWIDTYNAWMTDGFNP
jgi:hypothetical protein